MGTVTAQASLEVVCAGHQCGVSGRWVGNTRNATVTASREAGWQAFVVDGVMVDLCPSCAADWKPSTCTLTPPCRYPIAELLGHDREGHRIARFLARRWQVTAVGELMDWDEEGDLVLLPLGTRRRVLRALAQ